MLFKHVPRLLKLAGPMILSTSAITFMQIIDAIVLSRHSSESVAAIGPSGLAVILFQGFLFGTAGYAGTFVAHCHGRGDAHGVRTSTHEWALPGQRWRPWPHERSLLSSTHSCLPGREDSLIRVPEILTGRSFDDFYHLRYRWDCGSAESSLLGRFSSW